MKKHNLMLLLTGGEPLLRPDFREIYTGCKRMGLVLSVNTNASLIDDDMVELFAANPPRRVNITLYGASPETYGALCGSREAYARVVRAILNLQSAGVIVKLNFSVTPYNRHDAQAVYDFAAEHQLPLQAACYMFPPVRACEHGCYDADRILAFISRCREAGIDVPVIPGVKPLSTLRQLTLLPETFAIELPEALRSEVRTHADRPEAIRRIGVEWAYR